MRRTLLLTLFVVLGCATYDDDDIEMEPQRDRIERPRRVASSDITLPSVWWRDPVLAEPLALSSDQFKRLDALMPQQDEVDRLEDDAAIAMRDLRGTLQSRNATATEIAAAGKRLRERRDTLLDRQIALLASQREILTQAQWEALQEALTEEWRGRRPDRRQRMGGRGGFGGRRPGGVW